MRVQAVKPKPNNDIIKPAQEKPDITFQCSSSFCNTQDPSSPSLCNECTSKRYSLLSSTSKISEISQKNFQEKYPTPFRSPYPSLFTTEPNPIRSDQIEADQTKWCCEMCGYTDNLDDNEKCIICEYGRRPKQTKSSSTKYSERPITVPANDQLNKRGNILFQSVLFG